MSKQAFYLDELLPSEIFQLLIKAAEKHKGEYLEDLRIIFPEEGMFKYATLEVPDTDWEIGKKDKNRQRVIKGLLNDFDEKIRKPRGIKKPEGECRPLKEGSWLLFFNSSDEAYEELATAKEGECLIVTRDDDEKKAELLFKNLCFHATYTKVSGAGTREGSRYIFHVRDDPKRYSTLDGLNAAGVFKECQVLTGFQCDESMIFLPDGKTPVVKKLKYFCRFLKAAPLLFSSREVNKQHGLLASIVEWPNNEELVKPAGPKIDFQYLGNLSFFNQDYFTKRKVRHVRVEYMDLKDSPASLERLGEQINNAKPYIGYELELHPTRHLEKNTEVYLREQKEHIEYNLAYLDTISKARPVLMRFTGKQLPALADQLRKHHMSVIHDGKIKYGFQADEDEPGGFHFLLVYPRYSPTDKMDTLPLWEELDSPHMRFWLDPFWSRHYYRQEGQSLVFVPEGTALYPTMHDWDREDMDKYLREAMKSWFRDQDWIDKIPENPIYIFDGQARPKAKIKIFLLDRENMEPLYTRLGWINEYLTAAHRFENVEKIIHELAGIINEEELKEKIIAKAKKVEIAFEEKVLEASSQVANTMDEMTGVITEEIEAVIKRTSELGSQIAALYKEFRDWEDVLEEMKKIEKKLQNQGKKFNYQTDKAGKKLNDMVKKIEDRLKESSEKRKDIEYKVDKEISLLRNTRRFLREKLRSLKF